MNLKSKVIVGQDSAIRLILIAIFARGHVLLEGDVGVGKTTLLRAVTRGIGGGYERVEGTVDLMPNDLIYHTHLGNEGKPQIDPGPLLRSGENLSVFFFNEINRARPQVHSLLLRVMAERSLYAFKREYRLPHMLVFADRNQVEKEETFEIPSAARDRFMAPSQVISEDSVGTRDDSIATDDYNRYLSKLEGDYLQELSTEIGAKYSRATDAENLLNAMKAQQPAGYDTTRFPIDWLLILSAMCMVLAQYRRSLVIKFRNSFTTA